MRAKDGILTGATIPYRRIPIAYLRDRAVALSLDYGILQSGEGTSTPCARQRRALSCSQSLENLSKIDSEDIAVVDRKTKIAKIFSARDENLEYLTASYVILIRKFSNFDAALSHAFLN